MCVCVCVCVCAHVVVRSCWSKCSILIGVPTMAVFFWHGGSSGGVVGDAVVGEACNNVGGVGGGGSWCEKQAESKQTQAMQATSKQPFAGAALAER